MPTITKSALMPYTKQQMFDLVNAIEDYADFVPWCECSEVHSRSDDEVLATLTFAKAGMSKSFTTRNRLQPGKMIEMCLENGPFRHMQGYWRFDDAPSGSGCRVSFDLSYEFTNALMGMAFGPVFNQVANSLVGVFQERAKQVYGA